VIIDLLEEHSMNTERLVRVFAGAFVLVSLALGVSGSPAYLSSNWLWFTAFVGANLFQSGFTTFCPLEKILFRLGVKRAAGPKPA
jgi:Inner membrane protein YgaP-like, transmembrane domain